MSSLKDKIALSYEEAAELTGLSVNTLSRQVSLGNLPAARVGKRTLLTPASLQKFISERESAPNAR